MKNMVVTVSRTALTTINSWARDTGFTRFATTPGGGGIGLIGRPVVKLNHPPREAEPPIDGGRFIEGGPMVEPPFDGGRLIEGGRPIDGGGPMEDGGLIDDGRPNDGGGPPKDEGGPMEDGGPIDGLKEEDISPY